MNDLISVIIPTYNRANYLEETLESIFNQTYKYFEVILVDDGSTDETNQIIQKYKPKLNYLWQENQGVTSAMNRGILAAKGKYITFLDDDDYWSLDKTKKQLDYLTENVEIDIVFGYVKQFISPELSTDEKRKILNTDQAVAGYLKMAMMCKREIFLDVGLFDSSLRAGEFVDWFARAKDMNLNVEIIPDVICFRRLHTSNTRSRIHKSELDFPRALKNIIDRRRNSKTQ